MPPGPMELRKDPITRSWVVLGKPNKPAQGDAICLLCGDGPPAAPPVLTLPEGGSEQVRVFPHYDPIYRIEGDMDRIAEGIYDRMGAIGAHEIIIETPDHGRTLSQLTDVEIERVLQAYARRMVDLKKDTRFKYVTVFRNEGIAAGQEFPHAHSQVVATPFVPRRILYELRAARAWFREHERCVFCDILRQEEKKAKRVVDSQGDYVAFCPYASRVPYEVWIIARPHNHLFEEPRAEANRLHLASLLGRLLRRIEQVAQAYHMVLHTAPNTRVRKTSLADYWKTVAGDYHWHIEITPVLKGKSKSYVQKETYFNDLLPEDAAEHLRSLDPSR
jgi:UDPglucose--hexose-1-phosphate uridylyltransferase